MEPSVPSTAPAVLQHAGRDIAFDALEANRAFELTADSVTSRETSIPVDLVWRQLTFDVPVLRAVKKSNAPAPASATIDSAPDHDSIPIRPGMRRILHGLSGHVRTGQVLAIMGASGSGKTTLLNLLSGRNKSGNKCTSTGKILVNGAPRDYASFPHLAKFVEQDDTTMFAELTVKEQIMYAARLALPSTMSEAHKRARVEKILRELSLSKCENTYIGSPNVRGVSGGERRRAAIGVELVTDPALVFLDEPTTGLDSFNALNVMASLRHLARNGRTIVTTIHQPRSSIFHMFDVLYLIAEGRTVYFGPAADVADYFATLGFTIPHHFNVADFVIDILSVDRRTPQKEKVSTARVKYIADHYSLNVEPSVLNSAQEVSGVYNVNQFATISRYSNNALKEFGILAHRTLKLMARERQINMTRFAQTLFFSVLLGIIWIDTGRRQALEERSAVLGVLFFILINQCFDSAFGIVFSFPAEKAIINRERTSGYYRDLSYFVGKQLCELPRAVFFNLLLLSILYFMIDLRPDAGAFFILLLICILVALSGEGLAQAVSVFAGNEQTAAAVVPVVVILQVLFGGFFIQPSALPGYIAWGRWLSFIYYGFVAAAKNEFTGRGEVRNGVNVDSCILSDLDSELTMWTNIGIMMGFVVVTKLLYFAMLVVTKPKFDRRI